MKNPITKINIVSKIKLGFLIMALLMSSVSAGLFLDATPVHAAFNGQINYQGKLTNSSNVAVADGTYHMKFWILTSPSAATTTALWTEDRSTAAGNRITVSNGVFSVMLGSSTPLTTVDFNQTLYLGVEVGGSGSSPSWDGEMSPRKKLGAVPAAFVSDTVDGISSEQFLRSDASNSTSTASTFLTMVQNGAGKIAEFFGPSSSSVLSILSGGNIGIGTTTPYAKLSVVGQLVANYFTATSTAATSTFAFDTSITGLLKVLQTGTLATIIGDTTGDTRGTSALDIQTGRTIAAHVAAGNYSSTVGYDNYASGVNSSAIGYGNTETGYTSSNAIGNGNVVSGAGASAFGGVNTVSADNALAFGNFITNNIASSLQIGPSDSAKLTILTSGNLGVGSTSPYAKLSVSGNVVAANFVATTTATSTFAGSVTIGAASTAAGTSTLTIGGSIDYNTLSNRRAVFEGDSLTTDGTAGGTNICAPASTCPWPKQLRVIDPYFGVAAYTNVASNGTTTTQVAAEYTAKVHPLRPLKNGDEAYFFILAGTNDIAQNCTSLGAGCTSAINTAYANLKTIWAQARADGFKVVGSTLPLAAAINSAAVWATTVPTLNALILSDTTLYDYLARPDLWIVNNYASGDITYFSDGTHPTEAGNLIWARNISNLLKTQFNNVAVTGTSTTAFTIMRGNVGIGTTTPTAVLSVSSTTPQINLFNTSSSKNWFIGSAAGTGVANTTFGIADGTTNRFLIDTSGNIAVGTTSALAKLDVYGDVLIEGSSHYLNFGTISGTSGYGVRDNAGTMEYKNSGGSWSALGSGGGSLSGGTDGYLARWTGATSLSTGIVLDNGTVAGINATSSSFTFNIKGSSGVTPFNVASSTGTSLLVISQAGNLGIGTTTPYAKLSVDGRGIFNQDVRADYFTSTSTTATSTFAYDASVTGRLSVLQSSTLATIIGDTTGNTRGTGAVEIQSGRLASSHVASGNYSLGLGYDNFVSGANSSAVGNTNSVTGYTSSNAFGNGNTVPGVGSSAFGGANQVTVDGSLAFGNFIVNDVASSVQIGPTNTAKLTIRTGGGTLGVGTTSPMSKLDVYGDLVLSGSSRYLNFGSATGTSGYGVRDNAGTMEYKNSGGSWASLSGGGGGGSGTVSSGLTGQATYYAADGTTVSGTSLLTFSGSDGGGDSLVTIGSGVTNLQIDQAGDSVYFVASNATLASLGSTASPTTSGSLSYVGTLSNTVTAYNSTPVAGLGFVTKTGSGSTSLLGGITVAKENTTINNTSSYLALHTKVSGSNIAERLRITSAGNVGIGTTTPGAKLDIIGALCVDDSTPTCSNSARTDGTIYSVASLSATLDLAESYPTKDQTLSPGEIVALDPANPVFVSRATKTATTPLLGIVSTKPGFYLGGFNDELYQNEKRIPVALSGRVPLKVNDEGGAISVGDRIALSSIPGQGMKSGGSNETVGIALEAMSSSSGTIEVFVNLRNDISNSQFAITSSGNDNTGVALTQKLGVKGDISANGFAIQNDRSSMTNISGLGDQDISNFADKIKNIHISTYRYATDSATTTRMGIMTQDAPSDILTATGDVDIYKLAVFTLGGVKAEQLKIDSLEQRIAAVEALVALGGGNAGATGANVITDILASLGTKIIDGLAQFKNVITESLTIGSKEKPVGVTLFDDKTGKPYCVKVSGGQLVNVPGTCENPTTENGDPTTNTNPVDGNHDDLPVLHDGDTTTSTGTVTSGSANQTPTTDGSSTTNTEDSNTTTPPVDPVPDPVTPPVPLPDITPPPAPTESTPAP